MVKILKHVSKTKQYVTTKQYMQSMYQAFHKKYKGIAQYGTGSKFVVTGRNVALDDLLDFCDEQGIAAYVARTKDRDQGLKPNDKVTTWFEDAFNDAELLLISVTDYYAGLHEEMIQRQNKQLENNLLRLGPEGKYEASDQLPWELEIKTLPNGKQCGSLKPIIYDPVTLQKHTSFDDLPKIGELPDRREGESAASYAARLAAECEAADNDPDKLSDIADRMSLIDIYPGVD